MEDVFLDLLLLVKLDKFFVSFEFTRVKRSSFVVGDVMDKILK